MVLFPCFQDPFRFQHGDQRFGILQFAAVGHGRKLRERMLFHVQKLVFIRMGLSRVQSPCQIKVQHF